MHVLGGHDGGGSAPVAMALKGLSAPATDMSSMSIPGPSSTTVAASRVAAAQVPLAMPMALGAGMSDMSCCVLFLITGAALLALGMAVQFGMRPAGEGTHLTGASTRRREPPGSDPPRFSLCVLRV